MISRLATECMMFGIRARIWYKCATWKDSVTTWTICLQFWFYNIRAIRSRPATSSPDSESYADCLCALIATQATGHASPGYIHIETSRLAYLESCWCTLLVVPASASDWMAFDNMDWGNRLIVVGESQLLWQPSLLCRVSDHVCVHANRQLDSYA